MFFVCWNKFIIVYFFLIKNIYMLLCWDMIRDWRCFIKFDLFELNEKFVVINLFDKCLDKFMCIVWIIFNMIFINIKKIIKIIVIFK